MDYVRLGSAGLKVSRICLGCVSFGNGFEWMLPQEPSFAIVRKALDLGLLAQPGVTAPIVGATKASHLEDSVQAMETRLTSEETASTVHESDLNDSEVRGGLDDPHRAPLFGFNLSYSPRHRWYYAPRMQPDEILAFKLFDSDRTRVQWTGHTAFDDPTAAADAPPRESIEIRTISFMAADR